MPRTPLGRLHLRRAVKMPLASYLAPPIAKMLRGPCFYVVINQPSFSVMSEVLANQIFYRS